MTPRIVVATARRVLAQLKADRRTVALLLIVPSLLLGLTHEMIDSRPDFDRLALLLLGIFPFTTMFLVTSVAMLRERTSGTLERLLTTPMSKLDLLLGYGIAFAAAATAQAAITGAVTFGLLGVETPGSPWLVVAIAIVAAVLGTAIGLLASAFATTEFQAVQFMPAVVMPQILLGGLFVAREQMADWLQTVSAALPLTYAIDALTEVGRTSLVTGELIRDLAVMIGSALVALALAAATLRRRAAALSRRTRTALVAVPAAVLAATAVMGAFFIGSAGRYVSTDDAMVDGDAVPIRTPVAGVLVDWYVTTGSVVREDQPVGRVEIRNGFARPRMVIRAPAAGTVVVDDATEGAFVAANAQLAVATDLSQLRVTARIEETAVGDVRVGQQVDIRIDAFPETPLAGTVREIRRGTSTVPGPVPSASLSGRFETLTQVVPVDVAITDLRGLALVPGMSASVRIHRM